MSGICRAAGTLGGIVTVPGAMAGTLEGTTPGCVIGGDKRGWGTKSGTDSGESRGEGVRCVPFPIGNVYSALWGPEGAKRMISRTPNAVLGKKASSCPCHIDHTLRGATTTTVP